MSTIIKTGKIVSCEKCDTKFYKKLSWFKKGTRHFCSISCRNTTVKRSPSYPRNHCKCCQKTIRRESKTSLCQLCLFKETKTKLENMTINEFHNALSVKGKHPSWFNSNIRNLCRTWNANLLSISCQNCGYNKHIELCHIKPVSEFSLDTKLSIVNAPDNILVLCPNCHWEFDNAFINLSHIKPR